MLQHLIPWDTSFTRVQFADAESWAKVVILFLGEKKEKNECKTDIPQDQVSDSVYLACVCTLRQHICKRHKQKGKIMG